MLFDVPSANAAKEAIVRVLKLTPRFPQHFPDVKAMIFAGPSGTGKTHFVRILNTVTNGGVKCLKPCDIFHHSYGKSEANISEAFDEAEARFKSTGVVQFILMDEAQAIIPSDTPSGDPGAMSRVISTILQETDGFTQRKGTVLIVLTNTPWKLNEAMIRRFKHRVYFDLPRYAAQMHRLHRCTDCTDWCIINSLF